MMEQLSLHCIVTPSIISSKEYSTNTLYFCYVLSGRVEFKLEAPVKTEDAFDPELESLSLSLGGFY